MKFLARSDVLINDPKRTSWNSETSRPKIFSRVSFNSLKFLSHISDWDCGNVLWKYIHMYVCVTVWCREKWSVILTVKQIHSTRSHWDQNWPTGHILSHSSNDSCVYSSGAYQPVLITWTIWFQEGEKQRGQQNLIWIWVGYALYRMPMSDFKSEFHFAVGPLLW